MMSAAPVVAAAVVLLLCLAPEPSAATRVPWSGDRQGVGAAAAVQHAQGEAPLLLREVTGRDADPAAALPLGTWPPCSSECQACRNTCISDCRSSVGYCYEQCMFNDRCYAKG